MVSIATRKLTLNIAARCDLGCRGNVFSVSRESFNFVDFKTENFQEKNITKCPHINLGRRTAVLGAHTIKHLRPCCPEMGITYIYFCFRIFCLNSEASGTQNTACQTYARDYSVRSANPAISVLQNLYKTSHLERHLFAFFLFFVYRFSIFLAQWTKYVLVHSAHTDARGSHWERIFGRKLNVKPRKRKIGCETNDVRHSTTFAKQQLPTILWSSNFDSACKIILQNWFLWSSTS